MEEKQPSKPRIKWTPWLYHDFFKYAVAILLVLAILLLFSYDVVFLTPIIDFVSILFIPLVFSFLFYYLLRPIVNFLEGFKIPRWVGIVIIYLAVALLIVFVSVYLGPLLINQLSSLANISLETFQKVKGSAESIFYRLFYVNVDRQIEQKFFELVQQFTSVLSKNALDVIGFLTHIALVLAIIPFIVFYLLKDDKTLAEQILKPFSEEAGKEVRKILHNMDKTLSNYISGLVIVSLCVGVMLFFGYLLIGLDYALILSVIALIFMTIPFLGPFLSICPALFVALTDSPFMVLKVIIVFLVVQQCESNLISPQVIGQRLNIHPLTIILLLLAAGSLYGVIGLILATPLYALSKVLFENLYKIYRLHYQRKKS